MRIAVMGAGGVGGYFGARFAAAGNDVTFIARGPHLTAMREHGLVVESPLGDLHLQDVRVTDDPATLSSVDLVVFTVKLWDTDMAVRLIAPALGPETAVVSFQNGVQKDDALRLAVGDAAVMGGVCYVAATIVRPGVIRHTGTMQRLVFGEYDGRRSARTEALLDECRRGKVDADISADIRTAIWEKFVFLVGLSAATTTIRMPIGPIRTHPQTRAFLLDAMREVVAVGRAMGVPLNPDYAEARLAFCDGLPAEMTSSMHNDLEQGGRLEVQWLSGAVEALGDAVGVPTPVNRAVNDILVLHAQGHRGDVRAGR